MAANGNKKMLVVPVKIVPGYDELANSYRCALRECIIALGYTQVKVEKGGFITWTDYDSVKRQAFSPEVRDWTDEFDDCLGYDKDNDKFFVKKDAKLPDDDWTLVIREKDVIKVIETKEQRVAKRAKRAQKKRATSTRTVTTQTVGGQEAVDKRLAVNVKSQTKKVQPKRKRAPRHDARLEAIKARAAA